MVPSCLGIFFFFWLPGNKGTIRNRMFLPEGNEEITLWIINISTETETSCLPLHIYLYHQAIHSDDKKVSKRFFFSACPTNIILSIAERALLSVRSSNLRADCGDSFRAQQQIELILLRILSCNYPGVDLQWTNNYVCWPCRRECWFCIIN